MTSIAALQCVERNLITLDDPTSISTHLPELAALEILTGFSDDDKPILQKAETKITLRCTFLSSV
jgi:CubicO group peptidase (beta-lactamase class C family)